MRGRISINYDKALTQADRLNEAREKCESQIRTLNGIKQQLSENWNGESGNAMIEKCDEWLKDNQWIVGELEEIEKSIRDTVENIREADEEASKLME